MNSESSLLSKINSNYILKSILSLAYGNIKSVLKLCKYNKCLFRKLEINFEDYFRYEIEIKRDVNKEDIKILRKYLLWDSLWFIIFLIYIIFFYVRGKFNDENLKEGYSKKKKDFVDFMDNYILLVYFLFRLVTFLITILLYMRNLFELKGYIKLLIFIFIFLIDLTHNISYIIKFAYTKKLIKKELIDAIMEYAKKINPTEEEKKLYSKISKLIWFYSFDIFIIAMICFQILIQIFLAIIFIHKGKFIGFGEIKTIFLNQFKGLNIIKKELPEEFDDLSKKAKSDFIFKKENAEAYEYKLNKSQINLIQKINDIRKDNHIPLLKYNEIEKLPEFIIKEKTQLIFNNYDNMFKLSENFYVFKYRINEFQNFLYNNQILNIITIETLNEINIIEQSNFVFISIYGDDDRNKNYSNKHRIHVDINTNIKIFNIEDKLNEISERVSVTEIRENEVNEIPSIRNIKI